MDGSTQEPFKIQKRGLCNLNRMPSHGEVAGLYAVVLKKTYGLIGLLPLFGRRVKRSTIERKISYIAPL